MFIFILEDNEERMKLFREKFNINNIIWMTEARDAITYLKEHYEDMDNVFLDHDLGGRTFVSSDEYNTGFTVAKFISDNFDGPFNHVIIHSMNPAAAIRMNDLLPGSKITPFHFLF